MGMRCQDGQRATCIACLQPVFDFPRFLLASGRLATGRQPGTAADGQCGSDGCVAITVTCFRHGNRMEESVRPKGDKDKNDDVRSTFDRPSVAFAPCHRSLRRPAIERLAGRGRPAMPARPPVKLTRRAVDAFSVDSGDTVVWDLDLPGFGIRVYASGRKVWCVQARGRGGPKRVALGRLAQMPPDEARRRPRRSSTASDGGSTRFPRRLRPNRPLPTLPSAAWRRT